MKKILAIALCSIMLAGCYKDEVDIEKLNNNPFDRDYAGPAAIELIGTYTEVIDIEDQSILHQVIEVRVREDLFLSPVTSYKLQVRWNGLVKTLDAEPIGSNTFKFDFTPPIPGVPVCADYHLFYEYSAAGGYNICATL